MHLLIVDLLARYSHTWIHEHEIVFANDAYLRWLIDSSAEGFQGLYDLFLY